MITKPITQPSGVVASYWRPVQSVLNHEARTVNVRVAGWLDEAAYLAGRPPVVPPKLHSFGPEHLDALPETADLNLTVPVLALLLTTADFALEAPAEPPPEDPPA